MLLSSARCRIPLTALLFAATRLTARLPQPETAYAATFVVNTLTDAPQAPGRRGECVTGLIAPTLANAACSLRAAIQAANDLGGGGHPVQLQVPGTYTLTIPPTGSNDAASGDLNICSQVFLKNAS